MLAALVPTPVAFAAIVLFAAILPAVAALPPILGLPAIVPLTTVILRHTPRLLYALQLGGGYRG